MYTRGASVVSLISEGAENPDPATYVWKDGWDCWMSEVGVEQVDSVFAVTTLVDYQGYRCYVDTLQDDGIARISYAGTSSDWPLAHGFTQPERGVFRRSVNLAELRDFREEHTDLLFELWHDRTFGPSAGETP